MTTTSKGNNLEINDLSNVSLDLKSISISPKKVKKDNPQIYSKSPLMTPNSSQKKVKEINTNKQEINGLDSQLLDIKQKNSNEESFQPLMSTSFELAMSSLNSPSPAPILKSPGTLYSTTVSTLNSIPELNCKGQKTVVAGGALLKKDQQHQQKEDNSNDKKSNPVCVYDSLISPVSTGVADTSISTIEDNGNGNGEAHAHFLLEETVKVPGKLSTGSIKDKETKPIISPTNATFDPAINTNSTKTIVGQHSIQSEFEDGKFHVLIGITCSIINSGDSNKNYKTIILYIIKQLILKYGSLISINIILTPNSLKLININSDDFSTISLNSNVRILTDIDQWNNLKDIYDGFKMTSIINKTKPNNPGTPLHINLRHWADLFLIYPLSSNSLAKISLGLCDNLLMNVVRIWNIQNPIFVIPSNDWNNDNITKRQINEIKNDMKWIHILDEIKWDDGDKIVETVVTSLNGSRKEEELVKK